MATRVALRSWTSATLETWRRADDPSNLRVTLAPLTSEGVRIVLSLVDDVTVRGARGVAGDGAVLRGAVIVDDRTKQVLFFHLDPAGAGASMTSARRCGLKNHTQSEMTHRKGPCSRPRKRRQRLDERYRSLFWATAGFAGLDRTYAALGDLQHVSAGLLYRPASKAGQLRERSRSAWSLRRGQTGLSRSMDFDAVVAQLHADELEGRGEVE